MEKRCGYFPVLYRGRRQILYHYRPTFCEMRESGDEGIEVGLWSVEPIVNNEIKVLRPE